MATPQSDVPPTRRKSRRLTCRKREQVFTKSAPEAEGWRDQSDYTTAEGGKPASWCCKLYIHSPRVKPKRGCRCVILERPCPTLSDLLRVGLHNRLPLHERRAIDRSTFLAEFSARNSSGSRVRPWPRTAAVAAPNQTPACSATVEVMIWKYSSTSLTTWNKPPRSSTRPTAAAKSRVNSRRLWCRFFHQGSGK